MILLCQGGVKIFYGVARGYYTPRIYMWLFCRSKHKSFYVQFYGWANFNSISVLIA